jgi:hypothetical protein
VLKLCVSSLCPFPIYIGMAEADFKDVLSGFA